MTTSQLEPLTARTLVSRRGIYIVTGVLVALMLTGSVLDYAISQNLYSPSNGFGIFFAAFGEAPAFLVWVAAGTLLIRHRNRERRPIGVLQIVAGGVLITLATAAVAFMPSRYLTEVWPVLLGVIGVVLVAGTSVVTWRASRETDRRLAIRVALVLFFVPFLEMLIVNIVKVFWERPRMRMIDETADASFMHWWLPGYEGKDALLAAGIEGEEFKSFPSGHAANGAVAMLLTAFVALKDSLRPRADLFLMLGFAWALLVALSRVIAGAHFLTDVTMGMAITFVTILVAYRLAFRPKPEGIEA